MSTALDELLKRRGFTLSLKGSELYADFEAAFELGRRTTDIPSTPAQKIAHARELLIAATKQARATEKAERAADMCKCGHRRDQHTVTCSVNYSDGFCMRCQCRWFNFQEAGTEEGAR
jgi:hypothetical protein